MSRILLADGDEKARAALAEKLIHDGHRVIQTGDGVSAVALARREYPDLVVLDISLPKLNGLTVCQILSHEMDTSILMLTGRKSVGEAITALEMGADDYLVKPFPLEEFTARMRVVLRRANRKPMSRLVAGDLIIDLLARRAFRGDSRLELSRKEFDLLTELVRHPGTVLRRETLLSTVWGQSRSNTRTLDTHIHLLRKKIEEDPANPHLIQTVRGIGYRFQD